jgi:hypothetical protein
LSHYGCSAGNCHQAPHTHPTFHSKSSLIAKLGNASFSTTRVPS